jgi:adenosylmethionine-8-amino-7-oxononanoate aminotransferase
LNNALRTQLDKVAHVTSLGASNPTTIELARRLASLAPAGLEHVFFSSDGSSAVEAALKIAFQFWHQCESPEPARTLYIALSDAYHGDTLGSVSVGGVSRFHEMFRPLLFEVLRVPAPDTYRLPPGVEAAGAVEYYLAKLSEALDGHRGQVAAIVIEPLMQAAAGMLKHPAGYLRGVAELARAHNVLLIADEVAVGFGRTGTLFACEQEGVAPDLLCLGKGLTAGYLPMAATLATHRIWQAFLGTIEQARTFFHGHTYGGNPLAAAVALASLDLFEEQAVLDNLRAKVARLGERLQHLASHPQVGDIRQCGLMAGIELVADRETKTPYPWQQMVGRRVCAAALEHGVWLRPLQDVIVIMPPLSVTLEQLDHIFRAAYQGILTATA